MATEQIQARSVPAPTDPSKLRPLSNYAFHGLAGEIVSAIEPHSEADPAAILVQFLAAFGNAVGPGPGFRVEATRHQANLFVGIVGNTATAGREARWGSPFTCSSGPTMKGGQVGSRTVLLRERV